MTGSRAAQRRIDAQITQQHHLCGNANAADPFGQSILARRRWCRDLYRQNSELDTFAMRCNSNDLLPAPTRTIAPIAWNKILPIPHAPH